MNKVIHPNSKRRIKLSPRDKERVRNWKEYDGCMYGKKVWGKYKNGSFVANHGIKRENEFPIVWCMHDETPCKAYDENACTITTDHKNK